MSEKENRNTPEAKLLTAIRSLQNSFDNRHPENVNHMKLIEDKLDQVLAGFPEGDPDGHRRAHDEMIRKAQESTAFWRELRVKLAEKGIWAVVIFIGGALYWYAMDRIKR